MIRPIQPISTAEAQRRGRGGSASSSRGRGRFRPTVKPRTPGASSTATPSCRDASTGQDSPRNDAADSTAAAAAAVGAARVQHGSRANLPSAPARPTPSAADGARRTGAPTTTPPPGPRTIPGDGMPPSLPVPLTQNAANAASRNPIVNTNQQQQRRQEAPSLVSAMPVSSRSSGGGVHGKASGAATVTATMALPGVSAGLGGGSAGGVGVKRTSGGGGGGGGRGLRPGASIIAAPGSSLRGKASPGAGISGKQPEGAAGRKGEAAGVSGSGTGAAGASAGDKKKGKDKDALLPLTAAEVSTMKVADFCTSYKSRLPPKPREKGAKEKAAKAADAAKRRRDAKFLNDDKSDQTKAPQSMSVQMVNGKMVINDAALIVEGTKTVLDGSREEVDEDETTAATASSFTNRETPMRWKPHDIIKFYRGIQMYNLSFDMMANNMFKGERTQKQLKKKFEKELREHPEMIHRALRTQITKDHPYFSQAPPALPSFEDDIKPRLKKSRDKSSATPKKSNKKASITAAAAGGGVGDNPPSPALRKPIAKGAGGASSATGAPAEAGAPARKTTRKRARVSPSTRKKTAAAAAEGASGAATASAKKNNRKNRSVSVADEDSAESAASIEKRAPRPYRSARDRPLVELSSIVAPGSDEEGEGAGVGGGSGDEDDDECYMSDEGNITGGGRKKGKKTSAYAKDSSDDDDCSREGGSENNGDRGSSRPVRSDSSLVGSPKRPT